MSTAADQLVPYGFETWYPLVRPASGPMRVLDWTAELTADDALHAWNTMPNGAALVVIDRRERTTLRAVLSPKSIRAPLAAWTSRLENLERSERFLVVHAAGGRTLLIEASDPLALSAGSHFLYDERLHGRWTKRLLRAAVKLGWQERLCFDEATLLWKRTDSPAASTPLCDWIAARLPHSFVSARIGPPASGSKIVVQLAKPNGAADVFVKVGCDPTASKLIERERASLEKLGELGLTGVVAPQLRWAGTIGDARIVVHDSLDGSLSPERLQDAHLRFLEHLHARTKSAHELEELAMYRSARDKLSQLENRVDRAWHFIVERLHYLLALHLGERKIPCSFAHGDFAPWNLSSTPSSVAAFDWEHSKDAAPALYDLFHFVVQTGGLCERATPAALFETVRELIEAKQLPHYAHDVVARTNWIFLFGLYLFDIAVHEEHAHGWNAVHSAEYRTLREVRVRLASIVCDHLSHVALTAPDKKEERAA